MPVPVEPRSPFHIALLATGGTIEKSHDAATGTLTLDQPVIESLLASLDQPDVRIRVRRVMSIDSLDMGEAERAAIVAAVARCLASDRPDAIVITHGTDTLAQTAAALAVSGVDFDRPIILTGAMRPYRVADSDAAQNVAQAVIAARLLDAGVHAVFHGRVIPAPHIVKNHDRLTLVDGRDPDLR